MAECAVGLHSYAARVDPSWLAELDRLALPNDEPLDTDAIDWAAIIYEAGALSAIAVGFVAYQKCGAGKWAMVRYGVRPQWQRLGYGHALACCRPPRARTIETYTIRNLPSERTLKKAGFKCYGTAMCDDQRVARLWRWER